MRNNIVEPSEETCTFSIGFYRAVGRVEAALTKTFVPPCHPFRPALQLSSPFLWFVLWFHALPTRPREKRTLLWIELPMTTGL